MQRSRPKSTDPAPQARSLLKRLPAVSRLLSGRSIGPLVRQFGAELVTDLLRAWVDGLREEILSGRLTPAGFRKRTSATEAAHAVRRSAEELLEPRPRGVINATGVVVHTNLGRSVLSDAAAARVAEVARGYVDLEYDVEVGRRGSRLSQLEPLISRLFPGQSFITANNNAAAVMLCLRALSRGKEVLISRGELVEIGGSFRVPDILAASGGRLREVGTTNRTRLADYEKAITKRTGVILKVHTSNFRIVGFAEETSVAQLAGLAKKVDVPLVVDWGSGDLVDLEPLTIHDEMPVSRILDEGADLVSFSGDKLLGGPQAGLVVGRADLIERLRRDPLARVCRLDRLLIAALHQTLSAYVRGRAFEEVPTLRMLAMPAEEIGRRAERLRREVGRRTGQKGLLRVIDGVSRTGGGSSPVGERPTRLLSVELPVGDAGRLEQRLRAGTPPVIGRVQDGKLLLDLRTVFPEQERVVVDRLCAALAEEMIVHHATLAAGKARTARKAPVKR